MKPSRSGKSVRVMDGHALSLLVGKTELRNHLDGIDAPENWQPFSKCSKPMLPGKMLGRQVSVEVVETDRYGRKVVGS